MSDLDYGRFDRVLARCQELGTATGVKPTVARVFTERLGPVAATFRETHRAIVTAQSAYAREHREADEAIAAIDKPYQAARAVVQAYLPDQVLPPTLKALTTDTDQMSAIDTLLDVINDHASEPWAAEQIAGPFVTTATRTLAEVHEAIAADTRLAGARNARAAAYGPAWERYLAFKAVVRCEYGARSPEYRRIHVRGDDGPDAPPAPTPPVPEPSPK